MKNAHLKYLVGGIVIVGGVIGGIVAGMRKNEAATPEPAPPPKPPPKPATKPGTGPYANAADRDRRIHDATEALQSGDQAAISAAFARLSQEDRDKLKAMMPSL